MRRARKSRGFPRACDTAVKMFRALARTLTHQRPVSFEVLGRSAAGSPRQRKFSPRRCCAYRRVASHQSAQLHLDLFGAVFFDCSA